jgi:hypothetical protein
MSVPAPREPGQGGRWETIRYALDTNPRTFRLCLILSVAAVAPCLGLVVAEVIRHMLLRSAIERASGRKVTLGSTWPTAGDAACQAGA